MSPNAEECEKKAAELGFDLTKQFLSLAFAGIAFVVGLLFSSPGSMSSVVFWFVVVAFGASAFLGLAFLMHGVNLLSVKKSYDIYASSLRFLATFQIVAMLIGTGLLVYLLRRQTMKNAGSTTSAIEIQLGNQQTVRYPMGTNKNYTIEMENGKVKIVEDGK